MAVEKSDRTTLDMFTTEKRRGRLQTHALTQREPLKAPNDNQVMEDKSKRVKRIELKVTEELFNTLNAGAMASSISRSQLIESILLRYLEQVRRHSNG